MHTAFTHADVKTRNELSINGYFLTPVTVSVASTLSINSFVPGYNNYSVTPVQSLYTAIFLT